MRRIILLLGVVVAAQALTHFAEVAVYARDPQGRLIFHAGKTVVPCPPQDARTAVIFVVGQSNAANYGEQRRRTAFPDRVAAFFDGACSVAASPLLGSDMNEGESLTPMADELIRSGRFDRVVLAPLAVGGTQIARWAEGDLAPLAQQALASLQARYRVTHAIWHQGENDVLIGTSAAEYRRMFDVMLGHWRGQGMAAPVFVSVSTRCYPGWRPDNPIAVALRALPDPARGLHRGADTDAELTTADLRHGACHHSAAGQARVAKLLAAALLAVEARP